VFTGIVEKTRRVSSVIEGPGFIRLNLPNPWTDVRSGESIAINGCCLTVAEISPASLAFDVISETLSKTNLGLLHDGDEVHLERALRIGDRLDGHFVQGHVDGVARLAKVTRGEKEYRLRIAAPADLAKYLTPKGSVAIDGVSLTIAAIHGHDFEVALIPTTLGVTALGRREEGWLFNLEADVLSKTIISWLERREQ